jgi:hypothetical protein
MDGGQKIEVTVAAKLILEDEIVWRSTVEFIWRVVFRGYRCG